MNSNKKLAFWLLVLSISAGQLIKLPVFGSSGPIFLDLAVFLLTALGLIRLKFKLKSPLLFIKTSLLFLFIAFLSLIFTPLQLSINEYLISFSYSLRLFIYILFGWVIYSEAFLEIKNKVTQILLYSGLIICVVGLLQFIFIPDLGFLQIYGWDPHYFRAASTLLDPNFLGAFLVIILLILMNNNFKKNIFVIFFLLSYLTLMLTFSRSSYLMFFTSFIILSIIRKSVKLFFLTLVFSLTLMIGFNVYTQLITKPRNIDRDQSASFRLNTWQQGLNLFQRSPILGVGFNSYRFALNQYKLAEDDFLNAKGSSTNDSSLIYILATTGILGLISYLIFLASLIRHTLRDIKNPLSIIVISAISGLFTHSIFNNSLFYPFILIPLLLFTCAIPKK